MMKAGTAPSALAFSMLDCTVRKMLLFQPPSHKACGCLPILSRIAAFSGSLSRMKFARNIEFEFGSTQSLMPKSGLPVALGGTGGSSSGPLSPGSGSATGFDGPVVLPEGLLARASPAELPAQAPSREQAASSAKAVRPTGPTA